MKQILKSIICFALCSVFLLSYGMMVKGESAVNENKPIKILAIGNSYSNNATEYISRIAESMGLDITAASLYYQGCMLDRHVKHYEAYQTLGHNAYYDSSNKYQYEAFYVNGVGSMDNRSIQEAVAYTDWDYITLQQMPNSCDNINKYWTPQNPYLTKLYEYVKAELKKNGNNKCEILMHQGWSFSHLESTKNHYIYYPVDYDNTKDFFKAIESTVERAAEIVMEQEGLSAPLDIVESGKAVQLAKDEFGFGDSYGESDSLYADYISHLSTAGRYLVGCVWIETFAAKSGLTVDTQRSTYYPDGITQETATALSSCAHEAVTGEQDTVYGNWRAVPYKNGLKITHFMGTVPDNGNIAIPSELGGKEVKSVGKTAFKYINGVKSVNMDGGITIESGALNNIELIENVITADKNSNNQKQENDEKQFPLTEVILFSVIGLALALVVAAAIVFTILLKK